MHDFTAASHPVSSYEYMYVIDIRYSTLCAGGGGGGGLVGLGDQYMDTRWPDSDRIPAEMPPSP
jgi:hypothetical protein